MADYLDSLIARGQEAAPTLHPRVVSLFEPVPPHPFPTTMPDWTEETPAPPPSLMARPPGSTARGARARAHRRRRRRSSPGP